MPKPILAAQLYTVRQFTQTPEGFAESIRKVHEIGYTAVQISAIGPIPDQEVKRILEEHGMTVCITHTPFDQLWNKTDAVIEQHKLWNCPNVAIGSMPAEFRGSEEGFLRFANEASQVGERLAKAGLTFSYHNHAFEFVRFGRRTGLDLIYAESDPRCLMAEIDTYWVQRGGGSPEAWIRKMKDRMPVVHFKDMKVTLEGHEVQPVMAEIGEGNLDWPGILAACRDANVAWYAVEQDICPGDPFDSLRISYQNLSAMGLA